MSFEGLIDTQSDVYFEFKRVRSARAKYFFQSEEGKRAFELYRKFNRYKSPVMDYNGGYVVNPLIERPTMSVEQWEQCVRVFNNGLARKKRLRARVSGWSGYVYFVTLTFTDDQLELSADSRRHNMINPLLRVLREKYGLVDYIGVKEYGRKTDREHYHFLMLCESELPFSERKTIKTWKGRVREVLKGTPIEEHWKALVDVSEVASDSKDGLLSYITKVAGYIDKDNGKTQHLIYASVGVVGEGVLGPEAMPLGEAQEQARYIVDEEGFMVVDDELAAELFDIF